MKTRSNGVQTGQSQLNSLSTLVVLPVDGSVQVISNLETGTEYEVRLGCLFSKLNVKSGAAAVRERVRVVSLLQHRPALHPPPGLSVPHCTALHLAKAQYTFYGGLLLFFLVYD